MSAFVSDCSESAATLIEWACSQPAPASLPTNTPATAISFAFDGGGTFATTAATNVGEALQAIDDIITALDGSGGGIVSATDVSTLVNNGNGSFTHNAGGTPTTIAVADLINAANLTDALTDNGDGTYTHTALNGTMTVIDASGAGGQHTTISGIDLRSTGTPGEYVVEISWVDSNGTTQTTTDPTPITISGGASDVSTLVDNGNGSFTHSAGGTPITITIADLISDASLSDALVNNNDGTHTHTSLSGTAVTFNTGTDSLTDGGNGSFTHTDAGGTAVTVRSQEELGIAEFLNTEATVVRGGAVSFVVPASLAGYTPQAYISAVSTPSPDGVTTSQIVIRQSLGTAAPVTLYTHSIPATANTAASTAAASAITLAEGDIITINTTAVGATPANGLSGTLTILSP